MARKQFVPKAKSLTTGNAQTEAEATIAEAEALEQKEVLTLNGQPIPPEFAHVVNYSMTDQGIAEAAQRAASKPKPSGVRVTGDAWDKSLLRKAEAQVWDSFDPLREAVNEVREPGMTYRFLSDLVHKRRGRRGWEPVLGKDGKPVTVAGMTLGKMPIDVAERRNAHYQAIDTERVQDAAEKFSEDQNRAIRDAGVKGIAPLRTGETLRDNFQHPGMESMVGVHATRGEIGEAPGE